MVVPISFLPEPGSRDSGLIARLHVGPYTSTAGNPADRELGPVSVPHKLLRQAGFRLSAFELHDRTDLDRSMSARTNWREPYV